MTFRLKSFSHTPAALILIAAACGSPATQGDTGGATDSATTDASTSTATTGPTSGPTSGISATGTGTGEGSGSDSNTDATTSAATTEALTGTTGTTDPTTATTTTTTLGETTDTTGPDPSTSSTGDTSIGDTSIGDTSTGDSDSSTGDPVVCGDTLLATVRDFKVSHPDFEDFLGTQLGLVETDLGVDKKPVYAHPGATAVTSGPGNFAQWYNDVADVNQKTQIVLNLVEIQPGLFSYTNSDFFPIDGMLWGNEGNNRNFHFTTEIHTQFTYTGGESFTFQGDDDVWVFIGGKLVIDLGGVHGVLMGSVDLDGLGLQLGKTYPLDVFHAERHTTQSNFRIDTTICAIPQ